LPPRENTQLAVEFNSVLIIDQAVSGWFGNSFEISFSK
jgi:hypothetical protein